MITAKNVTLQYPDGTEALKGIDLQVGKGELIYITGPSGSGKTSLIKLLMGAEKPTGGELTVLNQPVNRESEAGIRLMRQKIGPVFQELKMIEGRTALENVMMSMRFLDIPHSELKQRAAEALDKVRLDHKAASKTENLSWGEKQRVAIARAVARRPLLILADEPTGNLDRENAVNILELMNSLRDDLTSLIITTHATHLIDRKLTSQLIHITAGKIQHISTEVNEYEETYS